jgi:hypothetical protein
MTEYVNAIKDAKKRSTLKLEKMEQEHQNQTKQKEIQVKIVRDKYQLVIIEV